MGSTLAADVNSHMGLSHEALADYGQAAVCHRCHFEQALALSGSSPFACSHRSCDVLRQQEKCTKTPQSARLCAHLLTCAYTIDVEGYFSLLIAQGDDTCLSPCLVLMADLFGQGVATSNLARVLVSISDHVRVAIVSQR